MNAEGVPQALVHAGAGDCFFAWSGRAAVVVKTIPASRISREVEGAGQFPQGLLPGGIVAELAVGAENGGGGCQFEEAAEDAVHGGASRGGGWMQAVGFEERNELFGVDPGEGFFFLGRHPEGEARQGGFGGVDGRGQG